jgi:hypothetical protein
MDENIKISMQSLIKLSVEYWRNKARQDKNPRFNREVKKFLDHNEIEIIDFKNKEYDPGMALKVLHHDNRSNSEKKIIKKTISPIITYSGKVVKEGEVLLSEERGGELDE